MRTIVENKYIRRKKSSENNSTLIVEKRKKNKSIKKKMIAINFNFLKYGKKKCLLNALQTKSSKELRFLWRRFIVKKTYYTHVSTI